MKKIHVGIVVYAQNQKFVGEIKEVTEEEFKNQRNRTNMMTKSPAPVAFKDTDGNKVYLPEEAVKRSVFKLVKYEFFPNKKE